MGQLVPKRADERSRRLGKALLAPLSRGIWLERIYYDLRFYSSGYHAVDVVSSGVDGPQIISAVTAHFRYCLFDFYALQFVESDRRLIHLIRHRFVERNVGLNQLAFFW